VVRDYAHVTRPAPQKFSVCALTAVTNTPFCTMTTGMATQSDSDSQCFELSRDNPTLHQPWRHRCACSSRWQVHGVSTARHLRAERSTYPSDHCCCGEVASCLHRVSRVSVSEGEVAPRCKPANQRVRTSYTTGVIAMHGSPHHTRERERELHCSRRTTLPNPDFSDPSCSHAGCNVQAPPCQRPTPVAGDESRLSCPTSLTVTAVGHSCVRHRGSLQRTGSKTRRTGSHQVMYDVATAQRLRPRQHRAAVTCRANWDRLRHSGAGRGPAVKGPRRYPAVGTPTHLIRTVQPPTTSSAHTQQPKASAQERNELNGTGVAGAATTALSGACAVSHRILSPVSGGNQAAE
jgi:hypothetical protein